MTYWKFRMGDAFQASDVLAEWIVTLGLAFNDLALVGTRLEQDQDTPHKFFYWTRLLISHFMEAGLYLEETKDVEEVKAFVASLPDGTKKDYGTALAAFEAQKRHLHSLRSHVFDYPELRLVPGKKKKRLMERVLEAHQDTETMVKVGKVRDSRLLFADDVMAELFQILSGGEEEFHKTHHAISQATMPLVDFIGAAIEEYMVRRGKEGLRATRVEPVDPDDWTKGWKDVAAPTSS